MDRRIKKAQSLIPVNFVSKDRVDQLNNVIQRNTEPKKYVDETTYSNCVSNYCIEDQKQFCVLKAHHYAV